MKTGLMAGALSLACVACQSRILPTDAQRAAAPTMTLAATGASSQANIAAAMTAPQQRNRRDRHPVVNPPAATPAEVIAAVNRAALCVHLAGEFNGDRSEHDAQLNEAMTSEACDTIKQDIATLQRRYPGVAALQPAIDGVDGL